MYGDVKLLEEEKIGNYSSFPHAREMWSDLVEYINEYIEKNAPSEHPKYGKYYIIQIPANFTKYSFWENLDFKVRIIFNETYQQELPLVNRYREVSPDSSEIEFIRNEGKLENLKVDLGVYTEKNNPVSNQLKTNFMHEFLHAYEDLQRIVKGNVPIETYADSINYRDYLTKRVDYNDPNFREINRLCTLFHFFSKQEIRALISQLSGEIQTCDELDEITAKDIITSTESWKEIEDAEYSVNLISQCEDIAGQQKLVETFNQHSVRKKVKSFNELVEFLRNKLFNVEQYVFKKCSKIISDLKRNSMTKYMN